ncbi:MAG TPA: heme o synthase [Nocardioides sp.]|uniref:heme o synthase n=1 Tax=Nocardioides sp. TaxID=35761 RepID=UPI002F3E4C51
MTVVRAAPPRHRPAHAGAVRAYLALTKPRIIELLLVTTVPAMVLARRGVPSLPLVLLTLVGGTLAAGSANALNCYFDRDIDAKMRRTSRRPLAAADPAYVVSPPRALVFASLLGVAATLVLGLTVNWLAAALADAAIVFYIVVYTLGLKRRTASNIVIGGAAGCFPALVGWAAVTGRVGLPALLLAAVVFVWTPPHFWALAMRYREDYAAAGVPMLPVVATPEMVVRKILVYTAATIAVSLTLVWYAGPVYGVCAVGLGGWFWGAAWRLRRQVRAGGVARPMALFHVTNNYLALLFVAVVAGTLVGT